jgi:hypothetical protein
MGNMSNPDYSQNVKQEARREYRSGLSMRPSEVGTTENER